MLAACSSNPSRAPLGGNYTSPETARAADKRAPTAEPPTASDATSAEPVKSKPTLPPALQAAADGGASVAAPSSDSLHYEPLKAGDQIKGDVVLTVAAQMRGGPPGLIANSKLSLDGKLLVELKVLKASPQSLDELELTITTTSMHTEFGGQSVDGKQDPPETYDVTLSGQSPNIRAHNGSKVDDGDRAIVMILVAPLVEFHAHWARARDFELKPGWTVKVPVSVPAFAGSSGENVHVGPFGARYAGRSPAGDSAAFELTLPVQYGTDFGKLDVELSGSANLSLANGRPTAIELNGPVTARGGPSGSQMSFNGTTKFSATLSYH